MNIFGGIEAGGTKIICATGDEYGNLLETIRIPTTTPVETMPQIIEFFTTQHTKTPLSALGIGSFGPVDPDPQSPHFGYITSTPKLAWAHFDLLGTLKAALPAIPMGFDTDVNCAAVGESHWGAAQGLHSFIYITIGTGIGGGGMLNGKRLHGLMHPEMGHIYVNQDRGKDPFDGVCPFHKNCLEGLASGPSINTRWNVDHCANTLPDDHPAWDIESDYLAQAFANYVLILSPQRIIVGGGVMHQPTLLSKVRTKVLTYLNGYVKQDSLLKHIDEYIVPPGLGDQSGILGAIALAEEAFRHGSSITTE